MHIDHNAQCALTVFGQCALRIDQKALRIKLQNQCTRHRGCKGQCATRIDNFQVRLNQCAMRIESMRIAHISMRIAH
jgi:hypothetical protein